MDFQGEARQNEHRERYAAVAAEDLRAASECQFSLLPYEELARLAGLWYDACAEATLRGNYAPVDGWVRNQARAAADHAFELVGI